MVAGGPALMALALLILYITPCNSFFDIMSIFGVLLRSIYYSSVVSVLVLLSRLTVEEERPLRA